MKGCVLGNIQLSTSCKYVETHKTLRGLHMSTNAPQRQALQPFLFGKQCQRKNRPSKGKVQKKEKKLTNVSFAFTHTYTLVKTNIFGIFSQACLENFEKCVKTPKKTWYIVPCLPVVVSFFLLFFNLSLCHIWEQWTMYGGLGSFYFKE